MCNGNNIGVMRMYTARMHERVNSLMNNRSKVRAHHLDFLR